MTLEAALTIVAPALFRRSIGELPRLRLAYNPALLTSNVSKSVCSDVFAKLFVAALLQLRNKVNCSKLN